MSATKRYLEQISQDMGLGGEITDDVMDRAQEIQEMKLDRDYDGGTNMARTEAEIVKDIANTYCQLSPENLYCDGERPAAQARKIGKQLNAQLARLFKELGYQLDEVEAYELDNKNKKLHRELDNKYGWLGV